MHKPNSLKHRGFSLVELVTVIVILGVLSAVTATRLVPQSSVQVQASRDRLVAAFFMAQQKAMSQGDAVRLSTHADLIDIRVDDDEDGVFDANESLLSAASRYPVRVDDGVVLSTEIFYFDRLGHTSAGTVTLTKKSSSATVTVSGTGYAY